MGIHENREVSYGTEGQVVEPEGICKKKVGMTTPGPATGGVRRRLMFNV